MKLTVEQIKARATSPRKALLVSIEEWTWRAEASEEEMRQLESLGSTSRCGLCCYYSCRECPLNVPGILATDGGCGLEFKEVYQLHCKWKKGKAKISELRIALWSMVARLDAELANLPEEKKEEPKLRHGDYGYSCKSGDRRIIIANEKSTYHIGISGSLVGAEVNGFTKIILGNIFDDLAALREDVEEVFYDVPHNRFYIDKRPEMQHAPIYIAGTWFPIVEAKKICLRFRQLLATAEKEYKQLCKEK